MPDQPSGPPSGSTNASNTAPAQPQEISHNPHHNAPPPASHKAECAKNDMDHNDSYRNQGDGHH